MQKTFPDTAEIKLGITMPKALFFENALITRKPLVEVEGLQKVIPKILPKSRKKFFFPPKFTILS